MCSLATSTDPVGKFVCLLCFLVAMMYDAMRALYSVRFAWVTGERRVRFVVFEVGNVVDGRD